MRNLFLVLTFVVLTFSSVIAQTDTEFWFAVPRVTNNHENSVVYQLQITSFGQASDYTVSMASSGAVLASGTVNANSIKTVPLNRTQLHLESPNIVENKGILITGTNPITCYFEISGDLNGEIYSLKGGNALGKDFIIPVQNFYNHPPNDWYGADDYTAFDIVATENNTDVTITPSSNAVGHAANTPFTITLQKGQTYSVRAADRNEIGALGGTVVTSTKPIAITITEDSIRMGLNLEGNDQGADVIGDQIVPVSVAGQEYIAIRGDLSQLLDDQEGVMLFGTQNTTSITITYSNSTTSIINLNRGQKSYIEIEGALGTSVHIKADKPILAYQVAGLGSPGLSTGSFEVGSAVLPSIVCTGSQSVAFSRMTEAGNFYLLLMTKDEYKDDFTFTSGTTNTVTIDPNDFSPVEGSDGMVSACINYGTNQGITDVLVNQQSFVSNSAGVFHLGIINGIGSSLGIGTATYGYFSDFGEYEYLTVSSSRYPTCGDIEAIAGVGSSYLWEDGSTTNKITVPISETQKDTSIYVDVTRDGCIDRETHEIIFVKPEAGKDSAICEVGDYVLVDVKDNPYTSLYWQFDITKLTIVDSTTSYQDLPEGRHTVTFIDDYDCEKTDTFSIVLIDAVSVMIDDTIVCTGDTVSLDVGEQFFTDYLWSTTETTDTIEVTSPTAKVERIIVTVTSQICPQFTNVDDANITFLDPIESIDEELYPTCKIDLSGNPLVNNWEWSTGETTENILYTASSSEGGTKDTVSVTSQKGACLMTKNYILNFVIPEAGNTDTICSDESVILSSLNQGKQNAYDSLRWTSELYPDSILSRDVQITANKEGNYTLTFYDQFGCPEEAYFEVQFDKAIMPDIAVPEDVCPEHSRRIEIINYDTKFHSYEWSSGETTQSISLSSSLEKFEKDTQDDIYTFIVTAKSHKCGVTEIGEATVTFQNCIITPPNVFTPNSDGMNDTWVVKHIDRRKWEVVIYNRWGKKVYESPDYKDDWTGEGLSDGVYYYIFNTYEIDIEKYNQASGYVHIIRE